MRESDLPVRSVGGADLHPSLNNAAATPPISSSVSCASSHSPEDRDRSASGVSRLGARSSNLSLCSLNPIFRYLSSRQTALSSHFVSVTMSATTTTVEATSAKSPAPVESAASRSTAT